MPFRRRAESDFQAEIEAHVCLEADRLIAEGMPPAEANAAARRAFGNRTHAHERFYESRQRGLWLHQLFQDLRFGFRSLRRTPVFTAAATLTIALGLGANIAVFSLMDAVLLRMLPVHEPAQLVFLNTAGTTGPSGPPPYPCLTRLRTETKSFSGLAAFTYDELRIDIDGKPEQVLGQVASGNFFDLLGVPPVLGRALNEDDERLNPPVAVISDRYWRRRFAADPSVIGRSISFRNQTFTIVGVTPPEFLGLQPGSPIDITLPIGIERALMADSSAFWLHGLVARLKPGVSAAAAQLEAGAVYRSFMSNSRLPADIVTKHFQRLEAGSASQGLDGLRRSFSKPLFALMGIVALVLLLAIANLANLLLARGISRGREFAIRLAAGAGRGRIVRQSLTETLLLFTLGAVPGILFALWGVSVIQMVFGEGRRPITIEAGLNWRVLAYSAALTLLAGLTAGLVPAWRAFRTDLEQAIREGQPRSSESRGAAMLTQTLVAFQVGLSLVLLVGAVTFVATLANLRNVDPGFRNEHVLTMSLQVPERHGDAAVSIAFWNRALETVRGLSGVRSAALCTFTPLSGRDRGGLVRIGGYQPSSTDDASIHINQVSEGYFETLGISLVRGRLFNDRDAGDAARVAVINESAAKHYFAGRDPLGQNLDFTRKSGDVTYRIVGVVQDTRHRNLREPAGRFAFIPMRQPKDLERRVTLLVTGASGDSGEMALLPPVRSALVSLDAGILLSDVITIRRQVDSTLLTERLLSGLSSAFGVLAVVLASIGLYGVLSYRIGRQHQAIGIRMALGASPALIAQRVLGQSGLVVALGLIAGLPFAWAAARMAESMLWGVKATDPLIYLACAALLALVGFVSAYLPARRASGIEPAEVLRHG